MRLARGDDRRPVVVHEPAKSVGHEHTFERDVDDPTVLRRELLRLAESVAQRLRRHDHAGRTVILKLRYATFQTITRSKTLLVPTDQATEIHRVASALLDALRLERVRVRLIGLSAQNLVPAGAARQLRLLADDRWLRAEQAADDARRRFGGAAVTRGALLDD